MAIEPGQKIGDYEIVKKLGAGGLGAVFEVRHLISQRREAMKIMLPHLSSTPEIVERFHREVQTLASLEHVNIAALHNAFYHEGQLAMVMELVHGETLAGLRLKVTLTLPQLLDYFAQILRALVYAHRLGVVHRDIKPSNIMITDTRLVKLLDFGIAFQEQSSHLTQTGYLLGSINYMSPEQVSGGKATAQSDLYSLGITLYELLTGVLPITGKTSYQILVGHMHQQPVPPHEVAPLVPIFVSIAVMRALAKDPAKRFQSAEEFLAALQLSPTGDIPKAATLPAIMEDSLSAAAATLATAPFTSLHPPVSQLSGGTLRPQTSSASGSLSLPLEELSRKLAVYIGPVAKFVVKKLAAQSDDLDFLYREAAKQIGSDADRAAFLRSKRQ
jgi:serine/threonine protein kinase